AALVSAALHARRRPAGGRRLVRPGQGIRVLGSGSVRPGARRQRTHAQTPVRRDELLVGPAHAESAAAGVRAVVAGCTELVATAKAGSAGGSTFRPWHVVHRGRRARHGTMGLTE